MHNSHIKTFIFLLQIVFMATACQKDITLGNTDNLLSQQLQAVTLNKQETTKTIDLSMLGDNWQIQDNTSAWLTATKKEGTLLYLHAKENNNANERYAQVILSTSYGKQIVSIMQFGSDPIIKVAECNGTIIYNHESHKDIELNIISNSEEWSVEQIEPENNSWITFSAKQKEKKLLLNILPIERNSKWAQTSRSSRLFLTNGNSHYQLIITQNGYVQFQFPVWDFNNFDINKITDLENKRNNQRDKAFEKDFLLPFKQDVEKAYYAFHSSGEQAPYIFYQPTNSRNGIFCAWLKAPKDKLFQKESYDSWLKQNGFKLGNKQMFDTETEYYSEDINKTRLVHVYNSVDNYKMHGGIYRSACMKYIESPNSLTLNTNGKVESLPVFPSAYLHNKAFKLEQVIEYERKRGMKPDFNNNFNTEKVTATTQDPLCKYSRLLFVPNNESNERGALAYVIYFFNWQGVTAEDIDAGLVANRDLSGTVGSCQVFYKGNDIFYTVEEQGTPGVYTWNDYSIPFSTRNAFQNKGYNVVREADGGFVSFYRGDEDLIDMRPQETRTVVIYYKSKHYVDLVKKKFNY
jgi:hypothetical protein